MNRCSARSISVVLTAMLVFSLAGTTGMGMLSQAFAVERNDSLIAEMHDLDEANDASREERSDDLFAEPREHYVYEYVYGVFSDEYTLASDEKMPGYGTLLSASQGEVLGERILVSVPVSAIEGHERYISFQKDGKYGVLDLPNKQVAIEPCYGSEGRPNPSKERWGFVSLGEQSDDGTYPNARAVVCSVRGAELLSVPLPQCAGEAYISCRESGVSVSSWAISWRTSRGTSEYRSYADAAEASGFSLISESGASSCAESTSDGRTVIFRSQNEKIAFTVIERNGSASEQRILATDNADLADCATVGNIIKVTGSNGYDYQYFTLDGSLLQNMNGQSLRGLGDYASYARTSFEGQQQVQVFLDTSDECREVKEVPSIQASFSGVGSNAVFECLTLDNKIQRYDKNLQLIKELEPTIDLVEHMRSGRNVSWAITDLGEDSWLLEVSARVRTGSYTYETVAQETALFIGSVRMTPEQLGFDSSHIIGKGTLNDLIYLANDGESAQLRLFDRSLKLVNEFELAPYAPEEAPLYWVSLSSVDHYDGMNAARVSLSFNTQSGSDVPSMRVLYLDGHYDLKDYEDLRCMNFQDPHVFAAKKNGKWGFIDADLNPRSAFIFDACPRYLSLYPDESEERFVVEENGKSRLLDGNLDDVLGATFDSIDAIGEGFCLVRSDGSLSVYDAHGQKIDLRGYLPVVHNSYSHLRGVRCLSDGTRMIYAQNAQGKTGAIDTAGNIVVPFEFEDYADCAEQEVSSSFIMLRDSEGWFFLSADELRSNHADDDECAALGHSYEKASYAPTCTTDGYDQYVCERCGSSYKDESSITSMLGHDFVVAADATAPTCTEWGKGAEYECARCGERKKDADTPSYGGHDYSEWRIVAGPTCIEAGARERTCNRCGFVEHDELAPYGHVWSYPAWTWTDDLQSAVAETYCTRGCGETQTIDAAMTHEKAQNGLRHSARININGRDYKDGRLSVDWVDSKGISRSLLVKGEPVADGFYAVPDGLDISADENVPITIDVTPVSEGGVFDALVAKIGSGWPAGTFDVRLSVDGDELHDDFGSLAFAFPAGVESAGKKATVYHCHKNDRDNISAHDAIVTQDGYVVLASVTDLSTFALSLQSESVAVNDAGLSVPSSNLRQVSDPATASSGSASASQRSGLIRTYDDASPLLSICALSIGFFCAALAVVVMRRRKVVGMKHEKR